MTLFFIGAGSLFSFALAWLHPLLKRLGRRQAVTTGIAYTLGAALLYLGIGTPTALDSPLRTPTISDAGSPRLGALAATMTPQQINEMVARLATRLKAQPDNPAGWRMLAQAYETLGRFQEAALAYQQLLALEPPDADLLVDYAVTLGMASGQSLVGEPETLLSRALRLDPHHLQAQALAGKAALERGDTAAAVSQWEHLLTEAALDAETRASIEQELARTKALTIPTASAPSL